MAINTGWEWFDNFLNSPIDPEDKWLKAIPIAGSYLSMANRKLGAGQPKSTLKPVEYSNSGMKDNWEVKSDTFGPNNLSNTPSSVLRAGRNPAPVADNSHLEGMMREIESRLARTRATAPTIELNTRPIDTAQESSKAALAQALDVVLKQIGTARTNTTNAYNSARDETQGAYDAIEKRSRTEGRKSAQQSGETVSDELAKAASVAMSGINQDMTNSEALLREASANLGGSNAALQEIDNRVDPNNMSETIRNNISQNYQDQAGNAARQTSRDVQAAGRYADTIGTDGASAIANLMAELAGRNNQFDRDIVNAETNNAQSVANIDSAYADKLMQAQLAQQQEQNAVNNAAWQTNINNDNAALQGMIDLMRREGDARSAQELEILKQSQQNNNSRPSRNYQDEALLKGLIDDIARNGGKNQEQLLELYRSIQ